MDRIQYSGTSVLTGSEIARALLEYAQALTMSGASTTVEVPSLKEDGSLERAIFLIGPTSQFVSETEDSDFPDVLDAKLVAHFKQETRKLGSSRAVPSADPQYSGVDVDDLEMPLAPYEADPDPAS